MISELVISERFLKKIVHVRNLFSLLFSKFRTSMFLYTINTVLWMLYTYHQMNLHMHSDVFYGPHVPSHESFNF